ncbi:hypothetical protein PAMA_016298 [Pampus argenteus]
MASQRFWCLAFMPTWIFLLSSVRSEMDAPKMYLNSTVFVACMGGNVSIEYKLKRPANQTEDKLTCYDPSNNTVYDDHTAGQQDYVEDTFVLKNLKNISGEYYCQYKTAKVYWFLRVIDGSYKETMMWDYTRLILIAICTGVLFVFSAVGSMYVITGHWITECGNSGKKQMQKREEKTEGKLEEDHVNAITDSSTSFYAVRTFIFISYT